MEGDSSG